MIYKATLGKEVRHSLYRDYPGDEWWLGYDELGTLPLLSIWKPLTIITEQKGTLPDWFSSGGKAIVSNAVRTICEQLLVAAEYLPIVLLHNGKTLKERFWVLHPLERLDCIDITNSVFEMYGQSPNFTVKRYKKLQFIEHAIEGKHLFRPMHDAAIYVSSEFRTLVESKSLLVGFSHLPGHRESAA